MKIKYRLILNFTIANIIIFTCVTFFISSSSKKRMVQSLNANINNSALIVDGQVSNIIETTAPNYLTATLNQLLNTIKTLDRNEDKQKAKEEMNQIIKATSIGKTGYIYITNSDGVIISHPSEDRLNTVSTLVDWIKENRNKDIATQDYEYKGRSKKLVMGYYKDWNWRIMVSAYTDEFNDLVNLEKLNEQMCNIKIGESSYPYIINEQGKVVTHKDPDKIGSNMLNMKDAHGEKFLSELIGTDEGFKNYDWIESDGSITKKFVHLKKIESTNWYAIIIGSWSEFYADINHINRILISSSIIGVLLIFLLTIIISRTIISPLNKLLIITKDISEGEGDLTKRINSSSSDETGIISRYLNSFIGNLHNLIKGIKINTNLTLLAKDDLTIACGETSSSITQITSNVGQINIKISTLDDNINDSSRSISSITDNIDKLNNAIESQNAMIEESTAAITQMIASISSVAHITIKKQETTNNLVLSAQEGRNIISDTNTSVLSVKEQLLKIDEMANIISDISSSTNLLAMNAAIEAAHAGDAGKGFAVVADEIRKLAESSNESSNQIQKTIKDIGKSINTTSEYSIKTGETFQVIDREILEVVGALNEIVSSTEELQIGGQELQSAIEGLRDSSLTIRNNSQMIKESINNVNNAMEETNDITKEVVESISEVSISTRNIEHSMKNVTVNIETITETSQALSESVNKFKIEDKNIV